MLNNKGLILIEAVASVVIVSVSLTLIAQSLLTNMRTGRDFVNRSRLVLAMENQLGLVLASSSFGSNHWTAPLTESYKDVTARTDISPLENAVSGVELAVWGTGIKETHALQIASMVYVPKRE